MAQRQIPVNVKLMAALVDKGLNVAEYCREQGISRSTFYKWRSRYRREGLAGLEERSRRPHGPGVQMPADIEGRIVKLRKQLTEDGLDAGPATIRFHLVAERADPVPSEASIWRLLKRRGFIEPQPQKAPRSSWRSFQFGWVNQCWQMDHYDWELADGTPVQIMNVEDDRSRRAHSRAVRIVTGNDAWEMFNETGADWGFPSMVLSDNGLVYNAHRRGFAVAFETNLRQLGIKPITSSIHHPQTCGKVERYHQTEQKWLQAHPPAETIQELNQILEEFNHYYNYHRPHRSLSGATPATVALNGPTAGPADTPILDRQRVTTAHVTIDGTVWSRPYRIAVGRHHAGTEVTVIIDDNQGYVFTGNQLLRHLTLDPTRQYQPLRCPR